jgi:hypothetical protein
MPTPFQTKLSTVAQQQFNRFHLLRENQPPLSNQIQKYWTSLGMAFPGVTTPWSAVFVSWCVQQAGATPAQFRFAAAHAQFVNVAIQNAQNGIGVFHGRRISSYAPKVGDILQNNRAGNNFDFAHAASNTSYASHSAIVIEVGVDSVGRYLRTIGGNEADSVGLKEVRLNSSGIVKNANGLYICVIETLL